MDFIEREKAIAALIDIISAETAEIDKHLKAIATNEESRARAIYQLVHFADARFTVSSSEGFDRVLSEFLLLEIYRTGTGTSAYHLQETVRGRFGKLFEENKVRAALEGLRRAGSIANRERLWFVSEPREEGPRKVPFDMKGKIIQILKEHPEGLRIKPIMHEVETRYKITANNRTVSPVLTKLKQTGVLRHEDKVWKLVDAPDQ